MSANLYIIGIDPAPKKDAVICHGNDRPQFESVSPDKLRSWIDNKIQAHSRVIISWDAPLTFDPLYGYSDRPVDQAVRAFIKGQNRLEKGAVSVRPFAGCPHWALTCSVLGLPFGNFRGVLPKSAEGIGTIPGSEFLIEVHPAVTIAMWWLQFSGGPMMPKYKGLRQPECDIKLKAIVNRLRDCGLLDSEAFFEAGKSDDHLDAWVAWRMTHGFMNGTADWLGDPIQGGYVLPVEGINGSNLREQIQKKEKAAKRLAKRKAAEATANGRNVDDREQAFSRYMEARGLVEPTSSKVESSQPEFQPLVIGGEPVSEQVIRERR